MRSSWRTIVAGLALALGAAVSALVPPAHAAGITIAIDPVMAARTPVRSPTACVKGPDPRGLPGPEGRTGKLRRRARRHDPHDGHSSLGKHQRRPVEPRRHGSRGGCGRLVSIHFNSGSPIANGAEIWYPNSSSYNYGTHTQGRALSNAIQKQLTGLGLADRGIKTRDNPYYDYPDGSTGDYYAIIRQSREENMTGIIVEHAFVTSPSDAALLHDANFVRSLGIADATGIAQAYGLSKGTWRADGDSWSFISNGTAKTGWFSTGGRWYWAGATSGRSAAGPRSTDAATSSTTPPPW